MDTDERYCCRAKRFLPIGYGVNQPVPVSIVVDPDPRAEAYLVQETPPATWLVTGIDSGGIYEAATGTIKWGPFFDNMERTLSYAATPPLGTAGPQGFDGIISVDGESEPVCGDLNIWAGSYHPADTDTDWTMEGDEVTAYAAAWLDGDPWTDNHHPIPADFVTNAGMLWRSGEAYTFDAAMWPPWVSTSGFMGPGGTAFGEIDTAGDDTRVSITVVPEAGTSVVAVEDVAPAGWTVTDISHDGQFDAVTQSVKWGPLYGSETRTLTYTAIAPDVNVSVVTFSGLASFDGSSVTVSGSRTLTPENTSTSD
jgi:hypothetical protein